MHHLCTKDTHIQSSRLKYQLPIGSPLGCLAASLNEARKGLLSFSPNHSFWQCCPSSGSSQTLQYSLFPFSLVSPSDLPANSDSSSFQMEPETNPSLQSYHSCPINHRVLLTAAEPCCCPCPPRSVLPTAPGDPGSAAWQQRPWGCPSFQLCATFSWWCLSPTPHRRRWLVCASRCEQSGWASRRRWGLC